MTGEFQIVDIWVGKFASKKALATYLETTYINKDDTTCRFATDQGASHVDEDFLESSFHRPTNKFKTLVKNHSYCESYLEEAEAAFKKSGVQAVNSIVLLFGGELEAPQSIESDAYSLTYLGRFRCDPNPVATTDSYIPYSLFLILDDGELFFDEYMRKVISVDPRGLCIGRLSDDPQVPLLDISQEVPEVADQQVKISRDQFDQWILADVAGNGLTVLAGSPLMNERTFPWQGQKLKIGTLQFTVSFRPKL